MATNIRTNDIILGSKNVNSIDHCSKFEKKKVSIVCWSSGSSGNCPLLSVDDRKKKLWELEVQVPILERKDILVNNPGPVAEGGQRKIFIGSWLKSKVAIKSFKSSENEMLNIREIIMLQKGRYPNVINIMGVVCLELQYWILMEYFHGKGLQELIFDPSPKEEGFILTAKRKNSIAHQLSVGMHFIHSQHPLILHRDVKPSNFVMNTI